MNVDNQYIMIKVEHEKLFIIVALTQLFLTLKPGYLSPV
jgi:hypothetical protein